LIWKRDLIWGIALLVISLVIFFYSFSIPAPPFASGLARTNPYIRMWAIFLAILSICLIVSSIIKKNSEKANIILTFSSIFTIGMLAIYLLVLPILGYIISTIIFLFVTMVFYLILSKDIELNSKKILIESFKYFAISIIITIIVQQIFVKVLVVVLPVGRIFLK